MQDDNNKNLILASVLSMLVLLTWFYFFPQEDYQPVATNQNATREIALEKTKRIEIKSNRIEGSLSLTGARIDDLKLLDYNVKLNDASEKVTHLQDH